MCEEITMYSSSSSSSSSPEYYPRHWLPVPRSYKLLEVLGEGGYGKVVKCVRRGTEHTVAVKIAKNNCDLRQEASMLRTLMRHNLDQFNIIKFYDKFIMNNGISLVLEVLDISLMDYLLDTEGPMRLEDIRAVIQQMSTALDALKRIGVIHTDVKPENIMMVDQVRQPFRVKLIDFSSAMFRSQAKPGRVHQTPYYRAPEIILGLPFSEAIDIWSLGCVMAVMTFDFLLFPGRLDYDALRFIIDLLGAPPDHLLKAGWKSRMFFKKTDSDQWILKTPEEYWHKVNYPTDNRCYSFRCLDEMKTMRLEFNNVTEADERRECIELLKAMLTWDGDERITPSGILNHPFITKNYTNSHLSSCEPSAYEASEPSTSHAQTRIKHTKQETQDDDRPHPAATPATAMDATRIHPDDEMDLSPITPDDSEDKNKKKKKKRNPFKRFFSWVKKKFGSC